MEVGDSTISIESSISYLGIVVSSNGLFLKTQSTLASQANKAVFKLRKSLSKFKNVPISLSLELFDKLISPILSYASEIWGFHESPDIERVHLSFCKSLISVKKSTQNDFVYGMLGRYPLILERHVKIIKYWLKVVSGTKTQYVYTLYQASYQRSGLSSRYNWAHKVKDLLFTTGFGDVWLYQSVTNTDAFLSEFKQRIRDVFNQNWNTRLYASPRARFYRCMLIEHKFHSFLDKITNVQYRNALIRLIVSSHRLHVETGRWRRPVVPSEQRLCTNCQKLEDEYHLLFECERFNELRIRLIPIYYRSRPSMLKCTQIINSTNRKTIFNLSKFVFEAFLIHSQPLQ